ncbi:DUF4190 domain-containing protein [Microbacterium sp. NPDC076895]|uniref:DUF4190 domain-containing protein n=1 Tax=Microbacterium sp. NPDC076895 TaxID=3154957 RepID=UPI003416A4B6
MGSKTNTLAVVSLISSILGVLIVPVIGQIIGIITGHIALQEIRRTREPGHGLALAGVVIGWVSIALAAIGIVILVAWWSSLAGALG